MQRFIGRCGSLMLLGAALLLPAFSSGCAVRGGGHGRTTNVYDASNHDWHPWTDDERQAYRRYWTETHQPFRPYGSLTQDQANSYWNWRHGHATTPNPR